MSQLTVKQLSIAALEPCDLHLAAGECVSLSGASGCGKSLLLRAIADIDPAAGEVLLDDESRNSMPAHVWRQRVSLVVAESRWWHATVGAHFPKASAVDVAALGFESDVMDWRVTRLSTGEKQRLSILRSLAAEPRIMLLDEPTASVDDRNVERIEALINARREQHRCGVIWVTHDRDQAAAVASRHYAIRQRRLAESA